MITGVMQLSYNKRAVPSTICERPILQGVCISGVQVSTQPSRPLRRYVTEIDEIQASIAHECRVLSTTDLHRIKDLFLLFSKSSHDWVTSPLDLDS